MKWNTFSIITKQVITVKYFGGRILCEILYEGKEETLGVYQEKSYYKIKPPGAVTGGLVSKKFLSTYFISGRKKIIFKYADPLKDI